MPGLKKCQRKYEINPGAEELTENSAEENIAII
jgi:hypothetical protein